MQTITMTATAQPTQPLFRLPPAGTFQANGPDDPLPYYYKPLTGSIYRARIEQALSLLSPPYGNILELGYGSGILLPSLCAMADSVAGIDLTSDPKQVQAALDAQGVQCHLVQGDVADDFFKEESFELIVAISIFEHISDLQPVLKRMHALLRPSGRLLVGMPRVDKLMAKAFSLIGFSNINDHHVTDYKTCIKTAAGSFNLLSLSHIPALMPLSAGLYFNMLFEKI